MDLTIRAAREDDAAAIVEMLNPIIEAGVYTIMAEPVTVEDQVSFIRSFPARGVFNVAICNDNGKLLGIQDVQPVSLTEDALRHVGQISTFVSLDSRRRGVGRALSRGTFTRAKEHGFRKIIAMIRADNKRAISFYEGQGFTTIGTARRHAFVRGRYIDEILMEKWLD